MPDDLLSPQARAILAARRDAYGRLVVTEGTALEARRLLDGVKPEQLLPAPPASYPHAFAALAGLWLRHDGLHECHEIAQKSPADLPHGIPHGMACDPSQKGGGCGNREKR